MKSLTILKSPYDDSKLKFNTDTDRYELTLEFVKSELEDNFKDDGILEKRIKKNSRKIYNYLYANSCSLNKQVVYFALKKTEEGRKFLFDLMLEQLEADLQTGYNDLSSQPAVNFANGQVMPREELFYNQLCVDAEQIADNSVSYFGFNLLYPAPYPFEIYRLAQTYNK